MGHIFDALKKADFKKFDSIRDYITISDQPIKVQVISPTEKVYIHWMKTDGKTLPIACLGIDNCPVCTDYAQKADEENNTGIPRRVRYRVNVVDLTPVKVCDKCQTVNGKAASKCSNEECQNVLINVDVEPMKRIRYLEGPEMMFTPMREFQEDKETFLGGKDILEVPMIVKKSGTGRDTLYTVVAQLNDPETINPEDYQDQLFKLSEVGIHVSYEEMVILLNGGSFKDVMSNRHSSIEETTTSLFG